MADRPDPKDLIKVMSISTVIAVIISLLCVLSGVALYTLIVYIGVSAATAWWAGLGCSVLCLVAQIVGAAVCLG